MNDSTHLEELEKEVFDLRQLLEISKSLSSNIDFFSLLDSILYICLGQMRVTQAGIFSRDNLEVPDLRLMRNQEGFELAASGRYVIDIHSLLAHYLFSNFKCYTVAELKNEVDDEKSFEVLDALKPSLLTPLKVKDQLVGVLILGERINEEEYSAQEKKYLLDIAHFASIAIHNAILFEMSTTDLMTHLKHRHYFFTVLSERVQSNKSGLNYPFSLIMGDIDHFKRINDTYGHQVGDEVIKKISSIIRENLRQDDVGSRYGGEEFIMLLQDAEEHHAFEIAERLRSIVESYDMETLGCLEPITVSFGVAEYEAKKDVAADELIQRVDRALYRSKEEGRNRITLASSL